MWKRKYVERRSGYEDRIEKQLKEAKVKYEYEPDTIEFRRTVSSGECPDCGSHKVVQRRRYTPDFKLTVGKQTFYIETKGRLTGTNASNLQAIKKQHPDLDLRLLFQSDNLRVRGKPASGRYSDWAKKYGFPFAVGEVPDDWIS